MKKSSNPRGAGRTPLPEDLRKIRTTVSVPPVSLTAWGDFAKLARTSKGQLVTWLLLAPEAKEARALAKEHARKFVI